MTLLVVEGSDGSGKTVLCRHLIDAHGARYMHSRVWRDCIRWHRGIIRRALRLHAVGDIITLDRIWPSELIYGPIFRGSCYADEVAEELDAAIRSVPHAYVLCVPSDARAHLARFEASKAAGREAFARVEAVAARYADLWFGNIAHPGDNLVDRFIRYGDFTFTQGRVVVRYDVDTDGRDLPRFAAKVLKAAKEGTK